MKILALVSQKGGVGKSLITAHLAVAFGEVGVATAVIDLDPQMSVNQWADSRAADDSPVVVAGLADRLHGMLSTARDGGIDLVIIDTPPHSDKNALTAIRAADLVLVPTRAAIFDLRAIGETRKILEIANQKAKAVILLNAVPARGPLGAEGEDAAKDYGLEIAPIRLVERATLSHALTSGLGITEFEPKGKAAAEIRKLRSFVAAKLGLKTKEVKHGKP